MNDDRIPEVLRRVDLDALVVSHGGREARSSGGRTYFHCPGPDHDDEHPSFDTYDPAAGGPRRWACRSVCGRSGDAIDLVVWLTVCSMAEAIDQLASSVGLERRSLGHVERTSLARWVAGRGWGNWVIEELGLSEVTDTFGRHRIRFPFRLDGQVPYHQDRATDDAARVRWLSPKGKRPIPYQADRMRLAKERGHVFVVEGVTDVVALVDVYTSPAVVGIPGASAWRPTWAPAFGGLVVFVVADNDTAGEAFRTRVAGDLQPVARSVKHLLVPPACNDVASWRQGLDVEEFDAQFMAAASAVADGSIRMAG
jgi:DNA primase